MTLQQKLLAKQSKKGFTLVELVVVIAILAILAAIAIPAVVGIIDNAQTSAKNANAAGLDGAAKKLYAGVTAGSIHSTTADSELGGLAAKKADKLPAKNDTTATKRSKANALTIDDAINYGGLATTFANENTGDYVFSTKDGTIVYKSKDITDVADAGSAGAARATGKAYQAFIATGTAAGSPWSTTTLGTIYGATTTAAPTTT